MDQTTLNKLSENVEFLPVQFENMWNDYMQDVKAANRGDKSTLLRALLEQCTQIIANALSKEDIEAFFDDLRTKGLLYHGACDTTWNYGDTAYKCKTCQLDPTTALCLACFRSGDHVGHDYSLQSVGGGFCDCGDPTAFKPSGFCQKHKEQTIDVTKYPNRFIMSLSYAIQFVLKKVWYFFESNKEEEYDIFMDWLLKLAQRGDVVKIIVIKYISNTDIGNTTLLPASPFLPTSLLTQFYHPINHALVSPRIKATFVNFCVFLRGSVEFIQAMIETVVPIYKQCIIEAKNHMILASYTIFSSSSVEKLLLRLGAVNVVMDTINTYFKKYLANRASFVRKHARVIRFKQDEIIDLPSYSAFLQLNTIPRPLHRLRTDIGFILGDPIISRSVVTDLRLLGEWFKMISLSQVLSAIESSHAGLKSNDYKNLLVLSSQYLGKWLLGWISSAKQALVDKEEKQKQKEEKEKGADSAAAAAVVSSTASATNYTVSQLINQSMSGEGFTFHLILHRVVAALLLNSLQFFDDSNSGGLKALFGGIIGERSPVSMDDYARCAIAHPVKLFASMGEIKAGMWRSYGREEDMNLQTVMYKSLYYQRFFDLDILLIQIGSALIGNKSFMEQVYHTYALEDWFKLEPSNNNSTVVATATAPATSTTSTSTTTNINNTPPKAPNTNLRQSSSGTKNTPIVVDDEVAKEKEKEKKKEEKRARKLEDDLQKKKILAEDFIQFIVMISTNKTLAGMTDEQIIRKELIHRLCLGDCTHSQVTRNIQRRFVNHPKFEEILLEVAVFQNPQKTEQGKFQLKEACWAEFDPYFAHYNTQDLQSAEERYTEFNNKTKSNIARGTFINYKPRNCFEHIDQLLCSKLVHQVLFTVLQNQLVGNGQKVTETLFTHALNAFELCINQSIWNNLQNKGKSTVVAGTPVSTSSQASFETKALDIEYPSEDNIFINANHEVPTSEGKKLSLMIVLVKLSANTSMSNEHKQQIQNILNLLIDNDATCKVTVESYYAAIKAKKASQVQSTPLKKEDPEEERKRMARARQAAILAQMKSQQNNFKFDDDEDEYDEDEDQAAIKAAEKAKQEANQLIVDGKLSTHTCALCREAGSLKRPMGRVAFIQPSSVLMLSKLTPEERKQRMTDAILKEMGEKPSAQQAARGSPASAGGRQTPHNALNELLGNNDDDDMDPLNDIDMGSEADDDSDDEVTKAMSFLNKISNFGEYFDDGGMFPDGHHHGFQEEEDDEEMEMDPYGEGEDDGEDEDSDDDGSDDDDEDDDEDTGSSSSSSSADDNHMHDQIVIDDEDGQEFPRGRVNANQEIIDIDHEDYYSSMSEDEGFYDDDDDDDDEAIYDFNDGGDRAGANNLHEHGDHHHHHHNRNPGQAAIQNMFRNILFGGPHPPLNDEDEQALFMDDYGEDEEEFLHKEKGDPVTGNPWSQKFSRQELFRNTEQTVNLHMSFCGHQIHEDCFNDYSWNSFKNQDDEEQLIDTQKGEFLCVLCRRIGNAIVPIIPDSGYAGESPSQPQSGLGPLPYDQYKDFIKGMEEKLTIPIDKFEYPESLKPVREAINQFASRVYSVRHNTTFFNAESNEKVTPLIASSIASTIGNTELAGRLKEAENASTTDYHLFGMSESNRVDIRSLFRASVSHIIAHPPFVHEGKMLWNSFSGDLAVPLPKIPENYKDLSEDDKNKFDKQYDEALQENFPPFLTLDLFHTFVQLYLRTSSKDSYVKATNRFYTILRVCFDAYLAQSIFHQLDVLNSNPSSVEKDQFTQGVNQLITTPNDNQQTISNMPKEHSSAIKSHAVVVNTLITHSDTSVPLVSAWSQQILSSYAVFVSEEPEKVEDRDKTLALIPSPAVPKPSLLIDLPKIYNTLSQQYSTVPCLRCKTISSSQAICLLCGTLCCLGSCCKRVLDQKNECVLHAEQCNAGTCMFLVLKSSSTLLIHQPRRTYWISPYLDDHGEEDINLRRGKTLYLNTNRYTQLNTLLLNHQIDQDSKIAEMTTRE
ncbi:hypothetical protein DFA_08926 [Cavenderia fasciculata]|uniref:E3 ubiquitin-protein ligase n=1 Tax=Cavenderia fasciculata TaxID=261658 RepID=F4Q532_CACFS|nr:uncharacterized protein DFA_08926 [Cavenderia fasciculata]EGG17925.1 hypothetical protein DFA_08926 [Cavenderia fasciculata]|eukprot:XP_004356409.1 hypothetical protein DFA_08926 [Cavenderia fasciculata]